MRATYEKGKVGVQQIMWRAQDSAKCEENIASAVKWREVQSEEQGRWRAEHLHIARVGSRASHI